MKLSATLLIMGSATVHSFTMIDSSTNLHKRLQTHRLADTSSNDANPIVELDVSDLGLTLADLEEALPREMLSTTSSGYQSTSRIPSVNDEGCFYEERDDSIDVTLSIPGLRGQPAAALSVLFSTTTISVTAFGRVIWSCIQRGISDVDECSFLTEEGKDGIPVIQLVVKKRDLGEKWGGYILQIGEDSIL